MAEVIEEDIEAAKCKEEQGIDCKQNTMVSVTDITSYMYCPRTLYVRKVLGYEEPPNKAMVLGSIRHSFYDLANKHEERIVARMPSGFTREEIIAAYLETYQNLLRVAAVNRANSLAQFDLDPFSVISELKPAAIAEAKERAENVFSFASRQNIFGEELWQELSPKILSELKIKSAALRLKGVVDKVELYKDALLPIELKTGKMARDGVWPGHRIQVAAYMMMLQEKFGMPVTKAVINYLDHNCTRTVVMNPYMGLEVKRLTEDVIRLLNSRTTPKPCGRERCACES